MEIERLPKRVKFIIDRMRDDGLTLCKFLRRKDTGETDVEFFFEPSGKRCGPKSAQAAVDSGALIANNDGLLGSDYSQTWIASPK